VMQLALRKAVRRRRVVVLHGGVEVTRALEHVQRRVLEVKLVSAGVARGLWAVVRRAHEEAQVVRDVKSSSVAAG
jgi:hypothetical protein